MGSKAGRLRRRLLILLLALCLGGAACLGYMGIAELMERRQGNAYYARLAEAAHPVEALVFGSSSEAAPESVQEEAVAVETSVTEAIHSTASAQKLDAASPVTIHEPEPSKPSVAEVASTAKPSSAMDFNALRESCPDAVGWIRVEGGGIDHPIVQGSDNDFYLKHLPDGSANALGSIMMDQANDPGFGDMLTILHGHHMRSGAMFGSLTDYRQEKYYRSHPTIRLFTPAGDCDAEIFAACTVNGYSFGYPTSFEDEAAFDQFVRKAVSATPYETGVDVQFGDQILLLSTCSYEYSGARYIVMARLAWPDEG